VVVWGILKLGALRRVPFGEMPGIRTFRAFEWRYSRIFVQTMGKVARRFKPDATIDLWINGHSVFTELLKCVMLALWKKSKMLFSVSLPASLVLNPERMHIAVVMNEMSLNIRAVAPARILSGCGSWDDGESRP
jgi:hypothetical protein